MWRTRAGDGAGRGCLRRWRARLPRNRWVRLWLGCLGLLLFLCLLAILFYDLRPRAAPAAGMAAEGPLTLVIDPGHGGMDGGAVAADGTLESGVNLSIAFRMYDLAGLLGLPAVLTRSAAELNYPAEADTVRAKKVWDQKTRAALIASVKNGVLVSVHQNRFPDPRPSGPQVLYGPAPGSKALGERAQANLAAALDPGSRRVAAPAGEDIYLMKTAACPAILAECGFLSNPGEAERLKTEGYQRCLALLLVGSVLQEAGNGGL